MRESRPPPPGVDSTVTPPDALRERVMSEEEPMHRHLALLALLTLVLAIGLPATAPGAMVPFDAKAFADAQSEGQSIVVAINATW